MLYFVFLVIYKLATDLLPTPVRPWPSPRMMGLVIGLVLRHLYGQSLALAWPRLSGLVLGLVLGLPVLNTTLVTAHPLLLPDAGWCSRKHPVPQIGRTMEILCKERHTICTLKKPSHCSIPKSRVKPIDQSHHQQSLLKEHFTGWPIKNGMAYLSQYVEAILPYFGKRKQVTYHPNLSYWCFHNSHELFFQAKFHAETLILLRDM